MAFELDHVLIWTDVGADVAAELTALGLTEGSSNVHSGQGTTNRRFFFHNVMLELLWIDDDAAARSDLIRPTYMWERWSGRRNGACPFGICLRPTDGANKPIAFEHWPYRPPYLPPSLPSIAMGNNCDRLDEPMLFQTPFGRRPDRFPPEKAQPLQHELGLREVSRTAIVSPQAMPVSPALQGVLDTQAIALRQGEDYCLELGFDRETAGRSIDFRPELPLVLSW
jgi:hypothetical protein